MRMGCAECDCVMDRGFRVVTCKDPFACCCGHLPAAPEGDEKGPRGGL